MQDEAGNAVKHHRFYLLGIKFYVITDNSALHLLHSLEPNRKLPVALWTSSNLNLIFNIDQQMPIRILMHYHTLATENLLIQSVLVLYA